MIRLGIVSLAVLSAMPLVATRSKAGLQKAEPRSIPATQVIEAIRLLTSYAEVGLPAADVITENRTFEGTVLAADVLTVHPGSRLILTASVGDRTDRYIFVRTLQVKGPGATITWDRVSSGTRLVAPVGKAPPGATGGGEGADGAVGPDGQIGNPGYPGRSAPTIYLVANRIEGGPIDVDLRGQDGGVGGTGQTGGDGGMGRAGARAFGILGLCRSPAGNGGNGGQGGNGGPGGEGGRGGNGGTLVLLAPQAALEKLAGFINADIRPGEGGGGGEGGIAGQGGEGGPPGRVESPCASGQAGKNGTEGNKGPGGSNGTNGQPGVFVKTALTDQQVRSLQLRGESRK